MIYLKSFKFFFEVKCVTYSNSKKRMDPNPNPTFHFHAERMGNGGCNKVPTPPLPTILFSE